MEAWVLFDTEWRKVHLAELLQYGQPLSEAAFRRSFPSLPALPKNAFKPR
jgi:hypothetical protein